MRGKDSYCFLQKKKEKKRKEKPESFAPLANSRNLHRYHEEMKFKSVFESPGATPDFKWQGWSTEGGGGGGGQKSRFWYSLPFSNNVYIGYFQLQVWTGSSLHTDKRVFCYIPASTEPLTLQLVSRLAGNVLL